MHCTTCQHPARYIEQVHERFFCSIGCQFKAPDLVEMKRERDTGAEEMSGIEMVQNNMVDSVRQWLTDYDPGLPTKNTYLGVAPSLEMARMLITEFGADPYAYAGDGKVNFDHMIRYGYSIREFLHAYHAPVDYMVQKLIDRIEAGVENGMYETVVLELNDLPTMSQFYQLINHGFFPEWDNPVFLAACEHMFFNRYDSGTLKFWTGYKYDDCLYGMHKVRYGSVEAWKRFR